MADNNTFVLFEEIKNKLEIIYKEVRELKEKDISSVSLPTPTAPAQSNEQQDQELLKQYELRTKEILNKYIAIQMRIKDEEAKSIDKLVASVLTMLHEWEEQKKQPQPQEHIHKHSFYLCGYNSSCFSCFFGRQLLAVAKQTAIQRRCLEVPNYQSVARLQPERNPMAQRCV